MFFLGGGRILKGSLVHSKAECAQMDWSQLFYSTLLLVLDLFYSNAIGNLLVIKQVFTRVNVMLTCIRKKLF